MHIFSEAYNEQKSSSTAESKSSVTHVRWKCMSLMFTKGRSAKITPGIHPKAGWHHCFPVARTSQLGFVSLCLCFWPCLREYEMSSCVSFIIICQYVCGAHPASAVLHESFCVLPPANIPLPCFGAHDVADFPQPVCESTICMGRRVVLLLVSHPMLHPLAPACSGTLRPSMSVDCLSAVYDIVAWNHYYPSAFIVVLHRSFSCSSCFIFLLIFLDFLSFLLTFHRCLIQQNVFAYFADQGALIDEGDNVPRQEVCSCRQKTSTDTHLSFMSRCLAIWRC
jgi:hypothetical protein